MVLGMGFPVRLYVRRRVMGARVSSGQTWGWETGMRVPWGAWREKGEGKGHSQAAGHCSPGTGAGG